MTNLFETVYSEDVFNLKPNLPEVGVTCEYYLTDYSTRKSFFYWHDEFKELEKINSHIFTDQDQTRLKFLICPAILGKQYTKEYLVRIGSIEELKRVYILQVFHVLNLIL